MMNEERTPLIRPIAEIIDTREPLTPETLYPSRYYVLIVLAVLNLSNGMIWMTFGSIPDTTCIYFNISTSQVDWLSIVFMIATIVLGLPAIYLLDKLGLRISIITSAWINAIGSVLRIVSCVNGIRGTSSSFMVLLTGQILCGCVQPFILFAPTKLAAVWFGCSERTVANMVASTANPIGIMLANIISTSIMPTSKEMIIIQSPMFLLMIIMSIPGFVGALLSLGVTRNKPLTPPATSATEETIEFWTGLKQLFTSKQYGILAFCYGGGMAIISSLVTIFDQLVYPYNYSNKFASTCIALLFGVGLIGAVGSSLLADRTRRHEYIAKINFGLAAMFVIALLMACRFASNDIMVALFSASAGFFALALSPLCLELAVESSFPVSEGSSAGLLIISGQIQAMICMLLASLGAKPMINHQEVISAYAVIFLMLLSFSISVVFLFAYKCPYRRLHFEEQMEADMIFRRAAQRYFTISDDPVRPIIYIG